MREDGCEDALWFTVETGSTGGKLSAAMFIPRKAIRKGARYFFIYIDYIMTQKSTSWSVQHIFLNQTQDFISVDFSVLNALFMK